ncbi:MAG: hypothetical protein KDE54_28210 [Caldilineaceae bacterium]|nr:hypothetical protein [Caldilineaceae bacterium]MCB0143375.1 hypothetical protein [Caldilineaceae bacterium]
MSHSNTLSNPPAIGAELSRIHWLLTVQSVVIILLTINRLSKLTTGYVASNEFLRWVDLHNMLTLPLISLVAFVLLKQHLEYASPARHDLWHNAISLLFIVSVYIFGAGYGDHEVTNYLHVRFCLDAPDSTLCRIIIFNDDEFSHWVWFAGFVGINATLMAIQALFPTRTELSRRHSWLIGVNALFIALGIFANLAFEEIGLDLYIVALLAGLAWLLMWRKGWQPLFVYYATAYTMGLLATGIVKILGL